MKIKFSIVTAIIAMPILFSPLANAGVSGVPTWSGNVLDDGKREDTTPTVVVARTAPVVKSAPASKNADASSGGGVPFWSGNTLGK
ncbi:hypothetical protein [Martelella alba]|uniref:DUF680 domain-containing protein n=1 Tax=Martelella alba TaxID=2590451 RepID=A0ABY2SRI6_9HYPH|nr:hypothetical protein [Martelella alba]TKI08835.1 hypothetical protein FCN80_01925 [Martelella alba]